MFHPLFKGLTRPAMIFGVPITPLFGTMGVILLLTFYTKNLFMVVFCITRIYCDETDDQAR